MSRLDEAKVLESVMKNKLLKWFGIVGFISALFLLFLVHPLPDGPAMFQGAPDVSQILRDHPHETEVTVSTEVLQAVLEDVQQQRSYFLSMLWKSIFFNIICLILFFILYRVGVGGKKISSSE